MVVVPLAADELKRYKTWRSLHIAQKLDRVRPIGVSNAFIPILVQPVWPRIQCHQKTYTKKICMRLTCPICRRLICPMRQSCCFTTRCQQHIAGCDKGRHQDHGLLNWNSGRQHARCSRRCGNDSSSCASLLILQWPWLCNMILQHQRRRA